MNSKLVPAVLVLVCLGLGAGWYLNSKKAEETRVSLEGQRAALSNELVATTGKLTEQVRVNANLETNLTQRIEDIHLVSNKWVAVSAELTRTTAEAAKAAETAKAELERRDRQISELEGEKDDLTRKIGNLESQIKVTERRLAASEGDREALKKELKRLIAEKADLEKKFNDLAILRDQVRKLKEELSIARRLEFIRRGLYGFEKKGAQLLQEGVRPKATTTAATNAYPLKVEVGTDGSSKVEAPAKP